MGLVFLKLLAADGLTVEATAYAKHEGELLPPGRWRVQFRDGRVQIMGIEEMPFHWREQVERAGRFGNTL